jgi:hypothetical protein
MWIWLVPSVVVGYAIVGMIYVRHCADWSVRQWFADLVVAARLLRVDSQILGAAVALSVRLKRWPGVPTQLLQARAFWRCLKKLSLRRVFNTGYFERLTSRRMIPATGLGAHSKPRDESAVWPYL